MLIVPEKELVRKHQEAKEGLTKQFNQQLEKIMNENQDVDKYWVLGKVRFPPEFDGKVAKMFLQGCLEKPPLVTEAFLYEIDNRKGKKTLLWLMNPGEILHIPTLGKTIYVNKAGASNSVAAKKGRRQKRA